MIPVVSRIVEVVAFRMRGDHPEYLVLRRSLHERVHPGMWQIITGMVEEGERGVDAALRELREETGLLPRHCWALPMVTSFYDVTRNAVNLCPVFGVQAGDPATVVLSGEHMALDWLPLAEARERLVWPSHRDAVAMVDSTILRGGEAAARLLVPLP